MNKLNKKSAFALLRRSINSLLYSYDKIFVRKNNLFILCYHSISDDNWFHSVKLSELKKQVQYLKKKGYKFVTLDQIYDHLSGAKILKSPSVAITIDDGYSDILRTIDFFDQENIIPTLFMISNLSRVNRNQLDSHKKLLSTEGIKKLQERGWKIGVHSSTHSNLSKINTKRLQSEIFDSKRILETEINLNINYFAYPFGAYNDNVLSEIRKAGYKMALSMDDEIIKKGVNILTIPRIGVNNSHSISEFQTIFSPSVIKFRKLIKNFLHYL